MPFEEPDQHAHLRKLARVSSGILAVVSLFHVLQGGALKDAAQDKLMFDLNAATLLSHRSDESYYLALISAVSAAVFYALSRR
jgi:hypothetical protein